MQIYKVVLVLEREVSVLYIQCCDVYRWSIWWSTSVCALEHWLYREGVSLWLYRVGMSGVVCLSTLA